MKMVMWQASIKYTKLPKCSECDDDRKITFNNPQGVKTISNCICNKTNRTYVPEKAEVYELSLSRDKDRPRAFYRLQKEGNDDEHYSANSTFCEHVYNGEPYKDVDLYRWFFKAEDNCQKILRLSKRKGD